MNYVRIALVLIVSNSSFGQPSSDDEGEQFPMPMPRLNVAAVATSAGVEMFVDADDSDEPAASLNILIVDDEEGVVLSPRRILTRMLGHQVTRVANAQEALGALELENFDLILMDHHMPETDGLEATRRIREAGHQIRIVSHSSSALPAETVEQYVELGVTHFFDKTKPGKDAYQRLLGQLGEF